MHDVSAGERSDVSYRDFVLCAGCIFTFLEREVPITVTPSAPDSQMSAENKAGQGQGVSNYSILAKEGTVVGLVRAIEQEILASSFQRQSDSLEGLHTPRPEETAPESLDVERIILANQGLSQNVIKTLLSSRRD